MNIIENFINFLPGSHLFYPSEFLNIAAALTLPFLVLVVIFLKRLSINFFAIQDFDLRLIWIYLTTFFLLIFYVAFPGYIIYDDMVLADFILNGKLYDWMGVTYSFLVTILYLIGAGYTPVPLISILYFSYLSLKFFHLVDTSNIPKTKKVLIGVFFALLSLLPYNQLFLLSHARDILFNLAVLHLSLIVLEKKQISYSFVLVTSVALVLLSNLREEGRIYLLIFPLILLYQKRIDLKKVTILCSLLSLNYFIYYSIVMPKLNVSAFRPTYKVTTIANPLADIISKNGIDSLTQEESASLKKFVNLQMLIDLHSPFDIVPYHQGAFQHNLTNEDWNEIRNVSYRIFLKNIDIYLASKINLAKAMLYIGNPTGFLTGDSLRSHYEKFQNVINRIGYKEKSYRPQDFETAYLGFLLSFKHNTFFKMLKMDSLLIPLLFVFFSALYYKWRSLQLTAILTISRLGIVFILAPAAYVKYVYSVLLFFIFFLPLIVLSLISKDHLKG